MFSKGSFFCAPFSYCSLNMFLPFLFFSISVPFFFYSLLIKIKWMNTKKKSQEWKRQKSEKRKREKKVNVSCLFSIHLYAMHFCENTPSQKESTSLKSIELHFILKFILRSLQQQKTANNTHSKWREREAEWKDKIYFHGFCQCNHTIDGIPCTQ